MFLEQLRAYDQHTRLDLAHQDIGIALDNMREELMRVCRIVAGKMSLNLDGKLKPRRNRQNVQRSIGHRAQSKISHRSHTTTVAAVNEIEYCCGPGQQSNLNQESTCNSKNSENIADCRYSAASTAEKVDSWQKASSEKESCQILNAQTDWVASTDSLTIQKVTCLPVAPVQRDSRSHEDDKPQGNSKPTTPPALRDSQHGSELECRELGYEPIAAAEEEGRSDLERSDKNTLNEDAADGNERCICKGKGPITQLGTSGLVEDGNHGITSALRPLPRMLSRKYSSINCKPRQSPATLEGDSLTSTHPEPQFEMLAGALAASKVLVCSAAEPCRPVIWPGLDKGDLYNGSSAKISADRLRAGLGHFAESLNANTTMIGLDADAIADIWKARNVGERSSRSNSDLIDRSLAVRTVPVRNSAYRFERSRAAVMPEELVRPRS